MPRRNNRHGHDGHVRMEVHNYFAVGVEVHHHYYYGSTSVQSALNDAPVQVQHAPYQTQQALAQGPHGHAQSQHQMVESLHRMAEEQHRMAEALHLSFGQHAQAQAQRRMAEEQHRMAEAQRDMAQSHHRMAQSHHRFSQPSMAPNQVNAHATPSHQNPGHNIYPNSRGFSNPHHPHQQPGRYGNSRPVPPAQADSRIPLPRIVEIDRESSPSDEAVKRKAEHKQKRNDLKVARQNRSKKAGP